MNFLKTALLRICKMLWNPPLWCVFVYQYLLTVIKSFAIKEPRVFFKFLFHSRLLSTTFLFLTWCKWRVCYFACLFWNHYKSCMQTSRFITSIKKESRFNSHKKKATEKWTAKQFSPSSLSASLLFISLQRKIVSIYKLLYMHNIHSTHNSMYFSNENYLSSARCQPKPDSGVCLAYIPRYGYNSDTKKCELFIYGGCPVRGNTNNFLTKGACERTCIPKVENLPANPWWAINNFYKWNFIQKKNK